MTSTRWTRRPPAGRSASSSTTPSWSKTTRRTSSSWAGPIFDCPVAPRQKRNILGVIDTVGLEIGKEAIGVRKQLRDLAAAVAGKAIHPVFGLPGGVSRSLSGELEQQAAAAAARAVS